LVAFCAAVVAFSVIMTAKVFPAKAAFVIANPKSKLLDRVREVLRVKQYSLRTEEAYVQWVRRFLKFHRDGAGAWRRPREMGAAEVVAFLSHLANVEHVSADTQNQALNRKDSVGNGFTVREEMTRRCARKGGAAAFRMQDEEIAVRGVTVRS
jgi:hypothetical protein